MNIHVSCELKLNWFSPADTEEQQFRRNYAQNVFSRIAFSHFKDQQCLDLLIAQIKSERLLEGYPLPEDTEFIT